MDLVIEQNLSNLPDQNFNFVTHIWKSSPTFSRQNHCAWQQFDLQMSVAVTQTISIKIKFYNSLN